MKLTNTSTITPNDNNSTHEFVQHHIQIDVEVSLESVSATAHDEITDAYHALIQAIALHANDYDTAQCSIASTLKQNFEIIGPF